MTKDSKTTPTYFAQFDDANGNLVQIFDLYSFSHSPKGHPPVIRIAAYQTDVDRPFPDLDKDQVKTLIRGLQRALKVM